MELKGYFSILNFRVILEIWPSSQSKLCNGEDLRIEDFLTLLELNQRSAQAELYRCSHLAHSSYPVNLQTHHTSTSPAIEQLAT